MNKIISTSLLCVALLATGCSKDGHQVAVRNALDDFEVKELFEVNGVKVYRFVDGGRYHYVGASSKAISVTSYVQSGKTTRPEETETVYK